MRAPAFVAGALVCAFVVVSAGGCASDAGAEHAAEGLEAVGASQSLVDEVVPLTAELIRVRPVNPPPGGSASGEAAVCELLATRLRRAGLDVEVAAYDDGTDTAGRANLKATLPGKDRTLPPVVLLGHSDVVPAVPRRWSVGPHEGRVDRGVLIGRGALDMLGPVALQALTLVALAERAQAEAPPLRDVVLLVTGDEEVNGRGVVAALLRWPELARAHVVLSEGGFILEGYLRQGEDVAAIAVAEKGLFQFELSTSGPTGHGSSPLDGAAAERLAQAVARVTARVPTTRLTPPTEAQLAALGRHRGGLDGWLLEHPALVKAFAPGVLTTTPTVRALYQDTCALTILEAGEKTNVIPGEARAVFDCRLLPGTDPSAFRDELLRVVGDPRVNLEPWQVGEATGSDADHAAVHVFSARVQRDLPATAVVPALTKGTTDCRFFRKRGVPCYGFVPVRINRDELDALHGDDERVRTAELEAGLARLVDATATLAQTPPAPQQTTQQDPP